MVRFAAVLCLLLAACFNPTFDNPTCGPGGECPSGTTCVNGVCMSGGGDDDGGDDGGDPDAIDASPDPDATDASPIDAPSLAVVFLPASASIPGTVDWIVNSMGTIDTTSLSATPAFPAGVTMTASMQTTSGAPEVAVLHVNRFQVGAGFQLNVRGSRPLVIVAGSDVVIDGILNVGATVTTPGAGGFGPDSGPSPGTQGQSQGIFMDDSGGGGAGYGSQGARGGDSPNNQGGNPGPIIGASPPTQLRGGSGGSAGGFDGGCPQPVGGAGGGAVLIASATSISVGGGINAGGGGGNGGANCSNDAPGGGGGGAGGQIDLQAPAYPGVVFSTVQLAANGGGGGGGGQNAPYGLDGQLSNVPAQGGAAGSNGGPGGDGAANTNSALSGGSGQNAGGGGGGVGRITVRYQGSRPTFVTSPPATYVTY